MTEILITGGAGFIGSNLAASLALRPGMTVSICDSLGDGEKWRNLARLRLGSVVPPEGLFGYLADGPPPMAIVHMGAISSTTARDADLAVATNVTLPQRLWRWCAEHGVRLIYASSAATYGDGAQGFDDDASAEALARLRPLNLYGWTKHVFDRWVAAELEAGRPSPPQWAGLKFFNVFGPNEGHKAEMISVVRRKAFEIAETGVARLFESGRADIPHGQQKRDFIWVGDCVAVMEWLLDHPSVSGLFNCGTGRARSYLDLAHAVFRAMGREPRIEFITLPSALAGQYQYFTEARMERLRAAGYRAPFTSLENGIGRYVQDLDVRDRAVSSGWAR